MKNQGITPNAVTYGYYNRVRRCFDYKFAPGSMKKKAPNFLLKVKVSDPRVVPNVCIVNDIPVCSIPGQMTYFPARGVT